MRLTWPPIIERGAKIIEDTSTSEADVTRLSV